MIAVSLPGSRVTRRRACQVFLSRALPRSATARSAVMILLTVRSSR